MTPNELIILKTTAALTVFIVTLLIGVVLVLIDNNKIASDLQNKQEANEKDSEKLRNFKL